MRPAVDARGTSMGWLRDSMRQAPGAPRSFGSVARAALGHPEWPKDSRPQARSLAALLSKLDRAIGLEWLADRPAVRQVLADVIGAPRSRIEEAAGIALGRPDEARLRLRFDDLPYASTFDLTVESLPPAMPEPVLNPAAWRRIWWVAPSGSGRSLVGTWLAARRLASFVAAPDFREAAARLPSAGPAFVELWSEDGDHAVLPPREQICVAAPFPPSSDCSAAWTGVSSPPPSAWLEPVLRWLAP